MLFRSRLSEIAPELLLSSLVTSKQVSPKYPSVVIRAKVALPVPVQYVALDLKEGFWAKLIRVIERYLYAFEVQSVLRPWRRVQSRSFPRLDRRL